jgi:hypothetical protein
MRAVRAVLLSMLAMGCSFSPGTSGDGNPGRRDGGNNDGTFLDAPFDVRPIDAPTVFMDASSTCIAQATSTEPVSGHHYFVTSVKTRDNAQGECMMFQAHLVKIETMIEDVFVSTIIPGSGTGYAWIGLKDIAANNVYVWIDGTTLSGYNGFSGATPPVSTMDCVDSNGQWSVYGCTQTNRGICECE